MTLIAAFRCIADDNPGVVICADSQETVGDYRVEVGKIKPRDAGNYDLVVGGSGNIAPLVDGLANELESNVKHWDSGFDEETGRRRLEGVLLAYHARQLRSYPANDDQKLLCFMICVRDKSSSQIQLWSTSGTVIETVQEYMLLGWEEWLYHYEVRRLFRLGLSTSQSVLLGLRLFTTAKATSNYIGGPTQVIVVRDNGMYVQDPDNIRAQEERVDTFNEALAQLVLACPDLSINQEAFVDLLATLENKVIKLRAYYTAQAVALGVERALSDPNHTGDAYPAVPLGQDFMVKIDDPQVMEQLRAMLKRNTERIEREQAEAASSPSDAETPEGLR